MGDIFISYRRADAGWAGRLARTLDERFDVFFDTEDIEAGDDFPTELQAALDACRVCCVVIGPEWVKPHQLARLAGERDWVRHELLTVLARQRVRVVPLLLGGAQLPDDAALPEPLRPLLRRNAFTLTHEKWDSDCQALIRQLERWLSGQAQERGAREVLPPVLPYLCDRVPQEEGLAEKMETLGHRHPVFVLPGHMWESHDGFLERLKYRGYLDQLFGSREVGVALCHLEWNRDKARAGQYADLLRRAIARSALQRLLVPDEPWRAFLKDPGQPMLLIMQITAEDLRDCGEGLLKGLVGAWHDLFSARGEVPATQPAQPLVLWINLADAVVDGDRQRAAGGLEGLLPALEPIGRGHIKDWLGLDEVRPYTVGRESRLLALPDDVSCCYEPGKVHMLRFAEAVQDILAQA